MKLRLIAGLVAALGVSVYGLTYFYNLIEDQLFKQKSDAVVTAYQMSLLAKVDRAEPYNGEKPYTIVYGEDKIGQKMIVWVGDKEVHSEFAAAGAAPDAIKQKLLAKSPGAQVLRISPGKLQDAYVWEVFYKMKEQNGERYYYDFYSFQGQDLDNTYKLSVQ